MKQQPASKPLKYRWRERIKSSDGPRDPVLRLLLLLLADWMKKDGSGCTPATSVLAEQSGLNERSVRERLKQADGVWFVRTKTARGYRYSPLIPPAGARVPTVSELRQRNHGSAVGNGKHRNAGARHRTDRVREGGTTVPTTHTQTSTQGGELALAQVARARRSSKEVCIRPDCRNEVFSPARGPYCEEHLSERPPLRLLGGGR